MEYKSDSSENLYLETSFGWDDPNAKLRSTYVQSNNTIRLNKVDETNHVSRGPQLDLKHVPELIEALIKIYNDNTPRGENS